MFKFLKPKEDAFFDLFVQIGSGIMAGSRLLKEMMQNPERCEEISQSLKTLEHGTDQTVHAVMSLLHKTFITPLERDDLHLLATRLDDILDLAEGAGARFNQYRPKQVHREVLDLCDVLIESGKLVQEMVALLRDLKQKDRLLSLIVEINRLEDQADHIRRSTIARLFRDEKDPFELIKWKDILEYIERATDRCEDVADIAEGIVIEHS